MGIRIYTGRYQDYKKIQHRLGLDVIGISLFKPKWFRGRVYKDLAPTRKLLMMYRTHQIDQIEFEKIYKKRVLSRLDPSQVAHDLDGSVILCYEQKKHFCHRHIVARWLRDTMGLDITEIDI